MARSKANLRVVEFALREQIRPSPEAALRRLFAEERRLEEELRKVRNSLRFERTRFAASHGLLVPPRMELLRTRFGGQS